MWIDNVVVDYTNWTPRSPSTYGDCVEIRSDTGVWFNTPCNGYRPYICKTDKGQSHTLQTYTRKSRIYNRTELFKLFMNR